MTLRPWMSTGAAAALAVGATLSLPAAPAHAGCKPDITREAVGNFTFSTKITARNRWRAAVRQKHGSAFATWTRADRKTEQCDKTGPGGKLRCVASARPCN